MKNSLLFIYLLLSIFFTISYADDNAIKQSLAKLDVSSMVIQPAPIAGIKTVLTNSGVIYVTEDGKYIIQGPMYDVSGKYIVNNTNQILMKNLNALEKEMIIYKAVQEKYVITVFTDINCSFCQKMHKKIKEYNALGITIRYLAFPRSGFQNHIEKDMKIIWCAKDRNKALDDKMYGREVQLASCNIDILNHYTLGVQLGITGTPAIVLENGQLIMGYHEPQDIKAFLEEHYKQLNIQ